MGVGLGTPVDSEGLVSVTPLLSPKGPGVPSSSLWEPLRDPSLHSPKQPCLPPWSWSHVGTPPHTSRSRAVQEEMTAGPLLQKD